MSEIFCYHDYCYHCRFVNNPDYCDELDCPHHNSTYAMRLKDKIKSLKAKIDKLEDELLV